MTTTHFDELDDAVASVSDEDVAAAGLDECRRFMQVALAGTLLFWLFLFGARSNSSGGMAIAMAGYVASMGGTLAGTSRGGKALELDIGPRIALLFLSFVPLLNIIPIAFFLGRSRTGSGSSAREAERLATIEAARERARARQKRAPSSDAAQAPSPAAMAVEVVEEEIDSDIPTQRQDLPELAWPDAEPVAGSAKASTEVDEEASRANALNKLSGVLPRIYVVDALDVPDGTLLKALPATGPYSDPVMAEQLSLPVIRVSHGIFGVAYMIDEGSHYLSVGRDDLDAAGITADRLHQMAMSNLGQKVISQSPALRTEAYGAAIRLKMDGEMESSLVLVDQLWDMSIRKSVPGDLCVAIPTRDTCVFCSAGNMEGLASLNQVVQHHAQVQSRGQVTSRLLRRSGGRWVIDREPASKTVH